MTAVSSAASLKQVLIIRDSLDFEQDHLGQLEKATQDSINSQGLVKTLEKLLLEVNADPRSVAEIVQLFSLPAETKAIKARDLAEKVLTLKSSAADLKAALQKLTASDKLTPQIIKALKQILIIRDSLDFETDHLARLDSPTREHINANGLAAALQALLLDVNAEPAVVKQAVDGLSLPAGTTTIKARELSEKALNIKDDSADLQAALCLLDVTECPQREDVVLPPAEGIAYAEIARWIGLREMTAEAVETAFRGKRGDPVWVKAYFDQLFQAFLEAPYTLKCPNCRQGNFQSLLSSAEELANWPAETPRPNAALLGRAFRHYIDIKKNVVALTNEAGRLTAVGIKDRLDILGGYSFGLFRQAIPHLLDYFKDHTSERNLQAALVNIIASDRLRPQLKALLEPGGFEAVKGLLAAEVRKLGSVEVSDEPAAAGGGGGDTFEIREITGEEMEVVNLLNLHTELRRRVDYIRQRTAEIPNPAAVAVIHQNKTMTLTAALALIEKKWQELEGIHRPLSSLYDPMNDDKSAALAHFRGLKREKLDERVRALDAEIRALMESIGETLVRLAADPANLPEE